jgi:hypothetical protein
MRRDYMENRYLEISNSLWSEACEIVSKEGYIITLKLEKKTPVIEVNQDMIKIKLDNGNIRELLKDHFTDVFGKLIKNKSIQQRNTRGNVERYILGLMSMMPYFKKKIISTQKPQYFIEFDEEYLKKFNI